MVSIDAGDDGLPDKTKHQDDKKNDVQEYENVKGNALLELDSSEDEIEDIKDIEHSKDEQKLVL